MPGLPVEFVQTLSSCLVSGGLYFVIGLGFGMVHRAGRFFHLAHGVVFTAGAYGVYLFSRQLRWPAWAGVPAGLFVASLLGPALWFAVYRPANRRGAGPLGLLLCSLGAGIVIQHTISLAFGDANLQVRVPFWSETITLGPALVTRAQVAMVVFGALSFASVACALRYTRLGLDLRATGDDAGLAATVGINSESVLVRTLFVASLLASTAGFLTALDTDMRPTMGMQPLLLGVCASMLGGVGEVRGLAIAAMVLGAVQHFGAWWVGIEWSESFAMLVLFLILVIRPEGIRSRARRAT
jgi:branched-chain amino acid transport system permease protein